MTDKIADWAEIILGGGRDPSGTGSDMPADDFTWTEGSNYGLDGFDYDQTLGEGLKNRGDQSGLSGPITPAQTKGMSELPDGLIGGDMGEDYSDGLALMDDGLDLSAMLSSDEGALHLAKDVQAAASLADLAWLDPTQEQDPERLPKELRPDLPPLGVSHELEDAWGVDRRTDGLSLVPNKDKNVVEYEESINNRLPAVPGIERNDTSWHIKKAVRMSHYGKSMAEIVSYLRTYLGDTPLTQEACDRVASEHGVAGNVFIRASAFPGIRNGKWVKELKKVARTARYVITTNPRIASKLSMEMVSEVPYRKALRQYLPWLQAGGYRVAAVGGDPKKTLQLAFLTGPKTVRNAASTKPVDVRPADRVTLAEARRATAKAPKKVRDVLVHDDTAKARKAAQATVRKAAKAGLISNEDALRLSRSQANPVEIRKAVEAIARVNQMPKEAVYGGVGTRATVHRQTGHSAAWAKLAQAELAVAQMKKAQVTVAKMVDAGQLTLLEGRKAVRQGTPKQMLEVAAAYAHASGTRKTTLKHSAAIKDYDGPVLRVAQQSGPRLVKLAADETAMREASASSGIQVSEFKSMARWARQQMSEGLAGDDLTAMMQLRFASPLRTAGEGLIALLREEHEGLSGHLYVDAAAYASKRGTKGCEKAASKHRANQIPFVKAMDRCSGCTLANANGVCMKYGKELLQQLPPDSAKFKAEMLHVANSSDHEITASLFDPGEFNLGNPMSDLDISEPAVTEGLDVLFGGLIL